MPKYPEYVVNPIHYIESMREWKRRGMSELTMYRRARAVEQLLAQHRREPITEGMLAERCENWIYMYRRLKV